MKKGFKTNKIFLTLLVIFSLAMIGCKSGSSSSDASNDANTSDKTAPTVSSVSPSLSSTYVNTIESIAITFSESITSASVNASTFSVTADSGTPSGSFSVDGSVATFSGTLPANTTINVTLSKITNLAGNTLANSYSYSFTTVPDPLFNYQWYLQNTGQTAFASTAGNPGYDINWLPVYESGETGSGVIVAVVDTGLEIAHEDLVANIVSGGSWDFVDSDSDPTSSSTKGDHGTSVAGIIAARGKNGIGLTGVAYKASLKGFNYISSSQTTQDYLDSIGGSSASPNSSDVYIFNQSFGTSNTAESTVVSAKEDQYLSGVTTLRGGKGAIYIKSAGNGFSSFGNPEANCTNANNKGLSCQNANMDAYNTLPYNIVVGAVDASGVKSSYSTAGSALWISAPGGEFGGNTNTLGNSYANYVYEPAMVTIDQSGCINGYSPNTNYNNFQQSSHALNANCNYTSTFNGTSSAAPALSGVVALILEAKSTLSWRDVKHILASTARQLDSSNDGTTVGGYQAELGWTTNAAGYKFHNYYGFGAVDADAAVTMASSYSVDLGTWTDGRWDAATNSVAIPDNSVTGASSTISYSNSLTIEAVQISVNISHPYVGDLGIELTSPAGTKSILFTIYNGFGADDDLTDMILASNAFYGENSSGNWTLKVIDAASVDTGTLNSWKVRIYGH